MAKGWLKYTTEDMHVLAEERGFEFLSTEYVGTTKQHQWMCLKKHTWWASPAGIKTGNGCKKCSGYNVLHNWKCLSCGKEYKIKPSNVQRVTSCRTCKLRTRKEVH